MTNWWLIALVQIPVLWFNDYLMFDYVMAISPLIAIGLWMNWPTSSPSQESVLELSASDQV